MTIRTVWPGLLALLVVCTVDCAPRISLVGGPAADGAGGEVRDAATAPLDATFGFQVPDGAPFAPPDTPAACVNLQCRQQACPAGGTTSLSGTVYAPNGTLPLYNVAVYVPNAPLDPFVQGSSCERCGTLASGRPIASALSDAEGKFKLINAPVGKEVPLVFQVGKWRRKVIIPEVLPCQDNALGDPQVTRLPRNRGEGDLPRVAITQGACDDVICLLPKLGIDLTETGVAGQDRAFIYYDGGGLLLPGVTDAVTTLWRRFEELQKYDMVINSCRCGEQEAEKGPAAFAAVTQYLDAGGRMFNTHFSYDFLKFSPDPLLSAAVTRGPIISDESGTSAVIDTSFPKGKALADWIKFLDPSVAFGQIPLPAIHGNLTGASGQVWARGVRQRPVFLTINTPAAASVDKQCGRVVDLDTHLTYGEMSSSTPIRSLAECGTTLNKAEHVLAFMLFDLAACIQEDTKPPAPPPVVIK